MWNGHSLTLLTTMRIGTASAFPALPARFNDKKVGIVRQNAQKNRADDAVDSDHVLVRRRKRVLAERVGHEHFARLPVVAAQEDEMSGRPAANVVGPAFGSDFAGGSVEVGCTQSRENGDLTAEIPADERARQLFEA